MDTLRDLPVLPAGDYVLRRWELTDLAVVEEAAQDPYIPLVNTVPARYTRDAGIAFVERQWGRPASGLYPFAIARAVDGRAVGHAGLRALGPDRASVGYWVAPPGRRAGAAAAALRAITAWGHGELAVARLELHVEPWNTGSQRTAESCGYQREGLMRDWMRVGGELRDAFMYTALRTPR
ncbi:GNAT family N-acetyltransferase [Actinacidiphila rubida]|uniref:Protein N-acetyltransferase, RimJ/RimL family n=1 Tax=Actinacidiphila rubida TaxID=310780 RepID=A0A1H8KWY4_9ACTN|nr:GNAT family protein [Actinacidiphila rubida]SEN97096.1 Protein N-acetyltransferase, RimJ/RimL family [Actinacidiphila rubida]